MVDPLDYFKKFKVKPVARRRWICYNSGYSMDIMGFCNLFYEEAMV
jgi:hypothetical protein